MDCEKSQSEGNLKINSRFRAVGSVVNQSINSALRETIVLLSESRQIVEILGKKSLKILKTYRSVHKHAEHLRLPLTLGKAFALSISTVQITFSYFDLISDRKKDRRKVGSWIRWGLFGFTLDSVNLLLCFHFPLNPSIQKHCFHIKQSLHESKQAIYLGAQRERKSLVEDWCGRFSFIVRPQSAEIEIALASFYSNMTLSRL